MKNESTQNEAAFGMNSLKTEVVSRTLGLLRISGPICHSQAMLLLFEVSALVPCSAGDDTWNAPASRQTMLL